MDFHFLDVDALRRVEKRNDNIMSRQDTWVDKVVDCVVYAMMFAVSGVIVIGTGYLLFTGRMGGSFL